MPTNSNKDVIYIDIDDEITAIIDKVRSSHGRIVALVLPKRASVLQSIVNMKLLKRSAESSKKHIVLITSEASLLPLAGIAGMHVASSLQSKPVVPEAGNMPSSSVDEGDDFDPDEVSDKPVGVLAGMGAGAAAAGITASDEPETIELDNDEPSAQPASGFAAGGAAASQAGKAAGKVKKDKKLNIPDFNKFRVGLIAGGVALFGLIIFSYFAIFVMPHALVSIETDSSEIETNASIRLDPAATEFDEETSVLPAKIESKQVNGQQQVSTTGQKNKGEKARGSVVLTLQNCDNDEVIVPAGTGVSSGGKTFITQSSVSLGSVVEKGKCNPNAALASGKTDVVAQTAGTDHNLSPTDFSVAGFGSVKGKSSSSMTDGTDNIVKSVTEADIENAKQKISGGDSGSIESELQKRLKDAGFVAVVMSLKANEPVVTTSANPGDESDTVTVTLVTTYTMYGVKKSALKDYILANIEENIDTKKQKILQDGVDKAVLEVASPPSSGVMTTTLAATSVAGPDINVDVIKTAIKGKKTNDVRTYVRSTPGVTDVSVKYSPFWVSKVPGKESKIDVVIEKSNAVAAPKTNTKTDASE